MSTSNYYVYLMENLELQHTPAGMSVVVIKETLADWKKYKDSVKNLMTYAQNHNHKLYYRGNYKTFKGADKRAIKLAEEYICESANPLLPKDEPKTVDVISRYINYRKEWEVQEFFSEWMAHYITKDSSYDSLEKLALKCYKLLDDHDITVRGPGDGDILKYFLDYQKTLPDKGSMTVKDIQMVEDKDKNIPTVEMTITLRYDHFNAAEEALEFFKKFIK